MVGVGTNVVTSVEITKPNEHDGPLFPVLVQKTAKNFAIREVSADKAYSSRRNLKVVDDLGGTAFVPFKSDATGRGTVTGKGEGVEVWSRMFHYYSLRKDEFFQHYHKRSNAESTFSMIKAKFGDSMRSKNPTAQVNEALCKILAHNICCVIQSMFELGVEPTFGAKNSRRGGRLPAPCHCFRRICSFQTVYPERSESMGDALPERYRGLSRAAAVDTIWEEVFAEYGVSPQSVCSLCRRPVPIPEETLSRVSLEVERRLALLKPLLPSSRASEAVREDGSLR